MSDPSGDEKSLLDGVRGGDPAAWRTFVDRYEGIVAATVIGMVGRGPDAEDIGQEVFVRFFKQAQSFRGDSSVATYLTRSAINLSLNATRRRKSMRRWFSGPAEVDLPSHEASPEQTAAAADIRKRVAAAIQSLKPEFRSVAVLRLVRDMSVSETAAVLGIPEGTVMSRLARAQRDLRQKLEGLRHG